MRITALILLLSAVSSFTPAVAASRIKELVSLEGVRENQLIGYGLVVGLAGTGDRRQTVFSAQSLANLLERMGLSVPPTAIQVKNTAAVMVTAMLPPFATPGSTIDVTVAAIGDASSLQGGVLVMTALKAADSQVYAVAQGPMLLGGYIAGAAGSAVSSNHPTVARMPSGAIVERPSPSVSLGPKIQLQLHKADFTTSARIADALNARFGPVARAENAALVSVNLPVAFREKATEFVAAMESLTVDPDRTQKIVLNERTGTIIMGKDVQIAPVAIMQGNLSIEIRTTLNVSQPGPLSGGTTQVTPQTNVAVRQDPSKNLLLKPGATVEELVHGLAAIGSTPRDIIAILQSLKTAGALDAEISVI